MKLGDKIGNWTLQKEFANMSRWEGDWSCNNGRKSEVYIFQDGVEIHCMGDKDSHITIGKDIYKRFVGQETDHTIYSLKIADFFCEQFCKMIAQTSTDEISEPKNEI